MKEGDLVKISPASYGDENVTGIILKVRKDVEYPLLVEVLWDSGQISRVNDSDLEIVGTVAQN